MTGRAPAKINLALVVGPLRADGKHELVTVFQRIDLADDLTVEATPAPGGTTVVEGFAEDTIVRRALDALGAPHGWRVRIEKRIPLAAGLGGGSSDAATALRLANAQLDDTLPTARLHALAAELGADVPFFLAEGPQLGTADGTALEPLDLPQDYVVLLLLPQDSEKPSTGHVYAAFDERDGAAGFGGRASALRAALSTVRRPGDLGALPPNDLARSPHARALRAQGAFRADVSGAGPAVYGLFERRADAARAAAALAPLGAVFLANPAW